MNLTKNPPAPSSSVGDKNSPSSQLAKTTRRGLLSSLALCLLALGVASAHAATIVVDRTDDANVSTCTDAANDCTLRGAIGAANTDADATVIIFDSGVSGIIQLGSSLTANTSIAIAAAQDQSIAVRGGGTGAFSIFINNSTLQLTNLTLSNGNVGVDSNTTLNANNCTFSDNGGGVLNNGTATLTNCTLSGDGNGLFNLEMATLNNCTVSGNGTGINNSGGTVALSNSIVAGNTTDVSGSLSSGDHNLTNMTAADAGLDPNGLQDNGGPTQTIALLPDSPALDAGNSTLLTDERGSPRPVDLSSVPNASGNGSDIGAFELNLPVVQFSSLTFELMEKEGPAVLTLHRTGDQTTAATVHFTTVPGTAEAGSDFTARSGDVTFPANGKNTKKIRIPITNDQAPEGTESFQVKLTAGANADIGAQGTATVTIVDQDGPPPTVQFSAATYQTPENRDHAVLRVERNGNRHDAVGVHFATSDDTAQNGSDYVQTSGNLIFPAGGAATATIKVLILNDRVREPDKTFKVTLTPTGSAALGPQKVATVTIIDKD